MQKPSNKYPREKITLGKCDDFSVNEINHKNQKHAELCEIELSSEEDEDQIELKRNERAYAEAKNRLALLLKTKV